MTLPSLSAADRAALGVVAILTAVRLWVAGHLGLVEDEAYYWVWTLHPAAGYFDHPPGVAAVIALGSAVLGDTERGVRAAGILLGAAAAVLAAWPARDRGLAMVALLSCPLFFLGGILATPDVPLAAAWALGLWAASRQRWGWVGLACGLAMLSKYTGVLLLPLIVLADVRALRTRGPWLAAAVAFVVYAPNALWNVQHDLVSWRFQLDHVSQAPRRLEFVLAQFALAGPLLGLAVGAWWLVGWRGSATERLLWWTSVPVLAVGIWAGGEANWAATAWIGGIVGLACRGGRLARAGWLGAGVNLGLGGLVLIHAVAGPLIELPEDPTDRLRGGRVLAESVAAWGVEPVYTERYQEAALIHFYSGIPAHAMPGVARPDQYDLWPIPPADRALFVRPHRGSAAGQRSLPVVEERGYGWDELNLIRLDGRPTWDVAEIRRE